MIADSVKFKGYRCFQKDWAGFDHFKPINVIIGRNNTGKSHLLKLVEDLCGKRFIEEGLVYQCRGLLDKASLEKEFNAGNRGHLQARAWEDHGIHFVNSIMNWEVGVNGKVENISFENNFQPTSSYGRSSTEERIKRLKDIGSNADSLFKGKKFRRILADRDILKERFSSNLKLSYSGEGATNIVSRYINSADLDRNLVQKKLLTELNKIFHPDATFTEITVQSHGDVDKEASPVFWEIYLGEEKKDIIALSESGSGLKTVFLLLLNLHMIPKIDGDCPKSYVFAFEELENNLHPALLRRLFVYLEDFAIRNKTTIFLTTHSNVALDIFGMSENATITRVEHDGESASTKTVRTHFDRYAVVSELGLKPSDLLQANGIIWVEGPSDRIYLNRWIDLFSDGALQEGRDYQCAFYGGALLGRSQFVDPDEADEREFTNLLWINPRVILVADGDRTAESGEGSGMKHRLIRIKQEVEKLPDGHIWITKAKEIKNYLPGEILSVLFKLPNLPSPSLFEYFFPTEASGGNSYLLRKAKRKTVDKIDLALNAVEHMTIENLRDRFELEIEVKAIIEKIRGWNA